MINDKSVISQIFGSLMKQPLLLSDTRYVLTPDNFGTSFEKCIFGAIYNLSIQGAQRITVVDIDTYLQNHEGIYQNFLKHNGLEYLNDCDATSEPANFEYYYNKLKKYNILNDLVDSGIDISDIYPTDFFGSQYDALMENFERMSVQDIVNKVRLKLTNIEAKHQLGSEIKKKRANEGISELLVRLRKEPDVGYPLPGNYYNTVVHGARLGKYYVRSADSGVGKTRSMVGEACALAYPFKYDTQKGKWIYNGGAEKVLFVGTEQDPEELQTMILANLTGFNEDDITYGFLTEEQEYVVNQAAYLMDNFSENLKLIQVPDPDIQSIKTLIRQEVLQEDYTAVFYDYIFTSPALLREFASAKLREDVLLMMFSTALKDIAVELNVFLQTSTQVTINPNETSGMKTKASIRGAKSIADKADVGCVTSRVSAQDKEVFKEILGEGSLLPNIVTDMYKVRKGRYNNVRIWSYMDLGTCRKVDLIITDSDMEPVTSFRPIEFIIDLEETGQFKEVYEKLNDHTIDYQTGEIKTKPPSEIDWSKLM